MAALSLLKIGRLPFLLFSYLSLPRILILLLLMVSVSIHLNSCFIFCCSVFPGNVIWRNSVVQCCTCSKWVHLLHSFPMLTTLFIQVQCCRQLLLMDLFLLLCLCLSWVSPNFRHRDFLLKVLQHLCLHLSDLSGPLCQCSAPTPLYPTNILFSSHSLPNSFLFSFPALISFWLFFYTSCFLFRR